MSVTTLPEIKIEPQDLAMEEFRKQFRLIAKCHVSKDGLIMTYEMETVAGAARWQSEAQRIITANRMPLSVGVRAERRGGVIDNVKLRIVYTPK